jgi:hypothetical protein
MNDMNFYNHPHWLPFYSSNGIVEINFYPDDEPTESTAIERLNAFIQSGLNLSSPNKDDKNSGRADFRLLDTFFSDSASCLVNIMDKVHSLIKQSGNKIEIQLLMADPHKSFAKSRAKSVSNEVNTDENFLADLTTSRTRIGLRKIAEAIEYYNRKIDSSPRTFVSKIPKEQPYSLYEKEIAQLIEYIGEEGEKENYNLKLLFFADVPSGPMFFIQNILIQGRFCYDLSSTRIPWMSIVNNPLCSYDFYDIFSMEFERIWQQSIKNNYRSPMEDEKLKIQKELDALKQSNEKLKTQIEKLQQENKQLNEYRSRFED